MAKIPQNSPHHKLYLSAEVSYLDSDELLTDFQQSELKSTLNEILSKIGGILQIEQEILDEWIVDRTDNVIDENANSLFAVAALTVGDPEYKYELLSCSDTKEIFLQLTHFLAEMNV